MQAFSRYLRGIKVAMKKDIFNYAFIDAQNLHMSIDQLGWKIKYTRKVTLEDETSRDTVQS
jgi:hypothetical protein